MVFTTFPWFSYGFPMLFPWFSNQGAVAAESGPALPMTLPATTDRPWAYFVSVRFAKGTVSVAAPVASTVAYATRGELCNEHGEFMGFHGDLMGLDW